MSQVVNVEVVTPSEINVNVTESTQLVGIDVALPLDTVNISVTGGTGGPAGPRGSIWYQGAGSPPSLTGLEGDAYLNTSNGDVYRKGAGGWGSPTGNIRGATGSTWYSGAGVPSNGTGANGDFYLNETNGDWYKKITGNWVQQGTLEGPAGIDGNTWYSGSGAPGDGTGADGDFYLRTDTSAWYGPKAAGTWTGTGPNSLLGANGADGRTWYSGSGAPGDGTGADGDFFLRTDTSAWYGPKAAGTWAGTGPNSLLGANGADGRTWYSGSGAPSDGTGANGDFFLRTDTSAWYGPKAGGTWAGTGPNSLLGANGADGAKFIAGNGVPAGGTGLNGDTYIDLDTYEIYTKAGGVWTLAAEVQQQAAQFRSNDSSTNYNVAAGIAIAWDVEDRKDSGFYTHSNVTNPSRITFDRDGWQKLDVTLCGTAATANQIMDLWFQLNGTTAIGPGAVMNTFVANTRGFGALSLLYNFSAGDYVEVMLTRRNGTATVNLVAGLSTLVCSQHNITSLSAPAAVDVSYDNSTSGLSATNVQAAIDEAAYTWGAYQSTTAGSNWTSNIIQCSKDTQGRVKTKGSITAQASASSNPLTLPVGYRPGTTVIKTSMIYDSSTATSHPCVVQITTAGAVNILSSPITIADLDLFYLFVEFDAA